MVQPGIQVEAATDPVEGDLSSREGRGASTGESSEKIVLRNVRPQRSQGAPSTFWRFREDIPGALRYSLIVVSIVAPVVVWSLLYLSGTVSDIFLPSPVKVVDAGYGLANNGSLFGDAAASLRRVAIGFGLALAVSIPLGLAMGSFRSIQSLFEPMIGFIRYMPATAFVPLLLIWLGLEEAPKIALIFLGTVFFNTLMVANLVWSVPGELVKVSYTLGARTRDVFAKVIFRHSVPGLIDAARVNLAAAWNLIIVAELLAADEGLGYRIVRAQRFLNIDQIFAILLVIGAIGLATDIGLKMLRNRIARWSQV